MTRVVAVAAGVTSLCGCIAIADFGDYDTTRAADEAGAADAGAAVSIASVPPIFVHRGRSVTFAVTVDRGSERGPISVEMSSLPAGVTVVPAVLPAGDGPMTTTLTITTTSEVTLGVFTAVLRASADSHSASATSLVTVGVRTTELDPTFGKGGIVIGSLNQSFYDFAGGADGTSFVAVAALRDDDPRLPGRFLLYRVDATGVVAPFLERVVNDADHRLRVSPRGELLMTSTAPSSSMIEGYSLTSGQLSWSTALDPLTTVAVARPAIAADGTIFIVSSGVDDVGLGVVYVRRLGAQGADPSVGAGAIRLPRSAATSDGIGAGVATATGLVVCTSRTAAGLGTGEIVVRRRTEDGGIDEAFGDGGELTLPTPKDSAVSCVDVGAEDARLVASANVGLATSSDRSTMLVAFGNDGRLDPSFGAAGVAAHAPSGSLAEAFAVAGGDSGAIYTAASDLGGAFVLGSRADGTPDPSFGAGDAGVLALHFGNSTTPRAVHVLADGRIVVAGTVGLANTSTWFVARYLP